MFFKQNWKYLIGATLLHLAFAGLFALTMISLPRQAPPPQLAIQAMIVDQPLVSSAARRERQQRERQERLQAEERDRQAAEQRKQKEEQARREEEQRAEQERQESKQQQEREQQRLKEEQELRVRQDEERKRQAEAEKQRQAETERKRVAEIERKQREEAERRKAAEEARTMAAREDELRRQLEEEEGRNQAASAGLLNQYIAMIEQRIVRNWNRPPSARSGLECEIRVTQTPTGTVLSAQVGKCNGDAAVQQSIEAAVLRSSPLPPPPDARLFERNLLLIFRPAD